MIVVAKGLGGDTELYFFYNNKKSDQTKSDIYNNNLSLVLW